MLSSAEINADVEAEVESEAGDNDDTDAACIE